MRTIGIGLATFAVVASAAGCSGGGASGGNAPTVTATVTKTRTIAVPNADVPASGQASATHATYPPPSAVTATDMSPAKDCSTEELTVYGNDSTSCRFAVAVTREFQRQRGKTDTIFVKSPTTGDTYGLRCRAETPGWSCATSRGAYVWMAS